MKKIIKISDHVFLYGENKDKEYVVKDICVILTKEAQYELFFFLQDETGRIEQIPHQMFMDLLNNCQLFKPEFGECK